MTFATHIIISPTLDGFERHDIQLILLPKKLTAILKLIACLGNHLCESEDTDERMNSAFSMPLLRNMSLESVPTKRVQLAVSFLVISTNFWVKRSSAFSVSSLGSLRFRDDPLLFAKASKKKKSKPKATSRNGGGFGRASAPEVVDDYAVFPALEQHVEDSLIPSPPELQEAGALPGEVYDRLDKIYGFPDFNYQNIDSDRPTESDSVSLEDLMSTAETTASSSSSMSDMDFADLLASATGDDSVSPKPSETATSERKMEAIASLPQFSEFRVLHVDPLVLAVDDFFTDEECDRYVAMSANPTGDDSPYQTRSKTVGKDHQAKAQRTSTTWFHHYKNVPELMSKASRLLGLDRIDQWEEAQVVR